MQCTAHLRDGSGKPCRKNAKKGMNVCGSHGGSSPQAIDAARLRMLAEADVAAGVLIEIMKDKKNSPRDRLTAVKDLLDRVGLKPVEQVEVTTVDESVVDREIRRLLKDFERL